MAERVGFVGLGIMGRGMARNLLKAGFPLTVWNRTASRIDELVAEGAAAGASPADVAAKSDIVITCVALRKMAVSQRSIRVYSARARNRANPEKVGIRRACATKLTSNAVTTVGRSPTPR